MGPTDPAPALSDDDLLSLSLGRVVRAHARLEYGLQAAQEANVLRNGIVHDLWLLESDSNDGVTARWNMFGASRGRIGTVTRPGPSGTETVEDAQTALDRAAIRVSGLFMALHEVLPRYKESPRHPRWTSGLPTYLALMHGNFRLAQNGDCEIDFPT